nr:hypothetical protein [uncultured Butyricicoccus sp.]
MQRNGIGKTGRTDGAQRGTDWNPMACVSAEIGAAAVCAEKLDRCCFTLQK